MVSSLVDGWSSTVWSSLEVFCWFGGRSSLPGQTCGQPGEILLRSIRLQPVKPRLAAPPGQSLPELGVGYLGTSTDPGLENFPTFFLREALEVSGFGTTLQQLQQHRHYILTISTGIPSLVPLQQPVSS